MTDGNRQCSDIDPRASRSPLCRFDPWQSWSCTMGDQHQLDNTGRGAYSNRSALFIAKQLSPDLQSLEAGAGCLTATSTIRGAGIDARIPRDARGIGIGGIARAASLKEVVSSRPITPSKKLIYLDSGIYKCYAGGRSRAERSVSTYAPTMSVTGALLEGGKGLTLVLSNGLARAHDWPLPSFALHVEKPGSWLTSQYVPLAHEADEVHDG